MNDCNDMYSTNHIVEVGLRKPRCFSFKNNTLNDWLKFIAEQLCCLLEQKQENFEPALNGNWSAIRQPRVTKEGNFIQLSGEITGGDVDSILFSLPFTPDQKHIFPIAHEFTPTTTYSVFIKIDVDRTVRLYFTGTAPTGTSSKLYLDNISFYLK